jgi:heat shock protein HtpX
MRPSTACAKRAGLPMPTVAVAPHPQPNAFATGRNPDHAVVCVTQGLLDTVNERELEGVLAHELGHIRNRDMLLNTMAATVAGAISYLAWSAMWLGGGSRDDEGGSPVAGLLLALIAPVAAMLIQLAISRQREFQADAVGAEISGQPLALASALHKLDAAAHRIPMRVAPAMAPLAQVNPLAAYGGGMVRLFATHPSTAERVARLERLARQM